MLCSSILLFIIHPVSRSFHSCLYSSDTNTWVRYATEICWTRENNGLASGPRKPKYLHREESIALGDTSRQLSKCELRHQSLHILF